MDDFPADLQELARALDDPASSAWWVGSAEGSWQNPSKAEWGTASGETRDQAGDASRGSSRNR